jgi:putative ABC transport system permease protein
MLRLTWAQMRRSLPRLTAAGIAIVIGTAFVAVTLLAGNIINRSVSGAIAAPYARADLVVGGSLDADTLEQVRTTPGVAAAAPLVTAFEPLTSATRTTVQMVIPTTPDPRLMPLTLADGAWPVGADQVALPGDIAQRLGVGIGDTLTLGSEPATAGDGSSGAAGDSTLQTVTVSGIVDDPRGAFSGSGGAAVRDAAAMTAAMDRYWNDGARDTIIVALADGTSPTTVRAALADAFPNASINTPDELAQQSAQDHTGGENVMFLVFVLTFAAIALLVAGLVITNTFQVLVAQRTRTLAMLRAVGASKRQVGQSVLVEATLLGLASSVAGVLVGCALGQATLAVGASTTASAFLPETITVTWPVVVFPLLVGTAVTVLAALVPARMATRVSPLAALRPADGPTVAKGSAGRVRLVLSLVATVGGLVILGAGAYLGTAQSSAQAGLLAGIAGGAISFVGIAVSAVFWLPRIASWSGRLVGLTGPTARLAAANTLRNPRRTAATSTALLIGVTLVAMMSTGAASARHTLTAQLDGLFPVDVQLQAVPTAGGSAELSPDVIAAVENVDGIVATALPRTAWLTIGGRYYDEDGRLVVGDVPAGTSDGQLVTSVVRGVEPADADAAVNLPSAVEGLTAHTVLIPEAIASNANIDDGDEVPLSGPSGEVTLSAVVVPGSGVGSLLVTPENLAKADAGAAADTMWVRLAGSSTGPVTAINDAVADTNEPVTVDGLALERADYEQVINVSLAIVVGLLAVAVVIALIGVANTLSLSVLERRRESATLRAIGVTRGQLRWMLAVEGMLIAGVGAVLGIVLGLLYGWAGSLAGLGVMGPVELAVPWRDIILVAVIALAAGLIASVAPGRTAARPSPVVALAAD